MGQGSYFHVSSLDHHLSHKMNKLGRKEKYFLLLKVVLHAFLHVK